MRQSLWEYITALGHWGWFVLVGVMSGIAGAYLDISGMATFPTWLWLSLLSISFVLVPFVAFHGIRKDRDKLQEKLDENRPRLTIGGKTGATKQVIEKGTTVQVTLNL